MNERQGKILAYIRLFKDSFGYSPSLRQIAHATDTSSISVISYNLDRLQEQGYISRDKDVARSIRLISRGNP